MYIMTIEAITNDDLTLHRSIKQHICYWVNLNSSALNDRKCSLESLGILCKLKSSRKF